MVTIQDEGDNLQNKIFKVICLLQESNIIKLCKEKKICEEQDRLLYNKPGRMLVSEFTEAQETDLQLEVLKLCHDSPITGHLGYKKNIELVTHSY